MTETPILQIKQSRSRPTFAAWRWRIAAAFLWILGAEIFLWTQLSRSPLEWLVNIVGYGLIATLLLDFVSRFQVREIFGALTIAGVFGLFSSLFLNPTVTLVNLPTSLFTRVLGAQFVAGIFTVLLGLLAIGRIRSIPILAIGALALGGWWGLWVQQYPFFVSDSPTSIIWLIGAGLVTVLALLIVTRLISSPVNVNDLRITPSGWVIMVIGFIGLVIFRLLRGDVPGFAWSSIFSLIGFCLLILWFQTPDTANTTVLSAKGSWLTVGIISILFVVAGTLTRFVPNSAQMSLFEVITTVYAVIGMLWLPTVVIVLGIRAYRQQLRTGRLL